MYHFQLLMAIVLSLLVCQKSLQVMVMAGPKNISIMIFAATIPLTAVVYQ